MMEEHIEAIRASVAPIASDEARAAGLTSCRAILAVLEVRDVSTTAPLAPPTQGDDLATLVTSILGSLKHVKPEQLLDMAIAYLSQKLPPGSAMPAARPINFHFVPVRR
ncbi:MAG: hypothetical protein ACKV2T_04400 [Kofleriaceae bacterium]